MRDSRELRTSYAGLAAVSAEPLRESAHRALIAVHLHEANYGEAVRQYERCRTMLREELGISPSPRLRDLLRADVDRHPAVAELRDFPAHASLRH